jgi:ribosome-binding protein aMBF1 (putative translation factor)
VPDVRRRRVEAEVITSAQIRQARELLGWEHSDLARRTHIDIYFLRAAERGNTTALKASQVDAVENAFQSAGVEFTNGDEPGVKLTMGKRAK